MAPLSDEESNYIRLALLLLGVSPRAVRTLFDKEFHPSNLHSTLNKNKPILHGLRLNLFQWNLLFPKNGLTNSSNFDVTLMILLIRNLTPVTPPLTGFDKLPTQAETSPESDLARIKWYRNILAHLNSDKIDTVFFNTAWGDIIEAVCRLGGKQMKDECQDLKVKILDQSNQELMNEIKNSQREIRELQDIINRLHNKALDILGGQIKKQSNQEITIAIKKAEREIRELGDIIERFNNKLWRCQSCSDIKDLTGEEVKYERGNTQIVIDQTKDDSSKTSKRKRHNAEHEAGHMHTNYKLVDGLNGSNGSNESSPYAEFGEGVRTENRPGSMTTGDENEASSRITGYSRNRNETMEHRGFTDSGPFQTIPENSFNSTGEENEASRRITGYSKNWDGLMERRCFTDSGPFQTMPGDSLDSTGEENEATRRITGYSKNWDGLMERRCFTDSGPFQTMPGDSLDSVQAEIETTNQNTMQTNYQNEEGGNTYFGVQNIQEDSWDSVFTMADVTSSGFMLRPGIHVPTHRYDFPNFTDRRDIQPFQQQTVQEDIGPTNRNTTHNNHQNEETGQNYSGFDDIPGDSWDSIFTIPDMRPSGIISRPDIPDPISRYNQEKNMFKYRKKCLWFLVLVIVIGGISGGLAKFFNDQKIAGLNDTPTIIIDDFPDKCENDVSTVTVGEQMCIPYTQKLTGSPSSIHVKQLSSQYVSALQGFLFNVSSDTFMQRNGDWIVNLNSSRPHQKLRFMMGKATCDSIGKYEISIEYDDGNVTSNKFEISLKDPQLQHSVTRIDDNIHIHCEMIKTCMASSLALFVNDGNSSRMIPNINVCSNNDQQSGTTVSVDAILGASWFSGNTTISCVPLITDSELAANLTSTTRIPVCEGDCVPDCKDDPQGEAYFPDKNDCTQFYQCSNGQLVSQSCSPSTYWSTSECTCVHFDDKMCNRDTNKFLIPLLSIEKCTNASLV